MSQPQTEARLAGLLLVDKEGGLTSHDVVQRARRALATRRVGHTGTLDPFATGLLLLAVGPVTRVVEYFHALPKSYEATITLGVRTDTHDPTGVVTSRSDEWRALRREDVVAAVRAHTGRLAQRPPAFSAKKVDGQRAYRAARRGERLPLTPAPVHVRALDLVQCDLPTVRLVARVSTGTYVRALARDIGDALGCGAYLARLRRTAIGPFEVTKALPAARLAPGLALSEPCWLRPRSALEWLERRELDEAEAERVRRGRHVARGEIVPPAWVEGASPIAPLSGRTLSLPVVLVREGEVLALAELRRDALQPRKVFDAV